MIDEFCTERMGNRRKEIKNKKRDHIWRSSEEFYVFSGVGFPYSAASVALLGTPPQVNISFCFALFGLSGQFFYGVLRKYFKGEN